MNTDGLGMVILHGPGLCARRKLDSWAVRRRVWRSRAPATRARVASTPPPAPRPPATGTPPLHRPPLRHEALDGLGQVAHPGVAPKLAVGVHVESHLAL